jgi:hypothetical protein
MDLRPWYTFTCNKDSCVHIGGTKCDVPPICFALIRVENLNFDKRARVAEILGVLGNGVAIQAGVAGVLHQIPEFFLPPLFP